jgi:hypothetical protein
MMKSRRMKWAGHVARMGEKRNVYRLLVEKPKGKRPLRRPKRRWIDNIKMDLLEIGLSVVDWIGLVQDRYSWRDVFTSECILLQTCFCFWFMGDAIRILMLITSKDKTINESELYGRR